MNKLESKLHNKIDHNWTQKVFNKELSKRSAEDKFNIFLQFMKKSKEMAKYKASASNDKEKAAYLFCGHHSDDKA